MEWKHILITKKQNTTDKGYGEDADGNSSIDAKLLQVFAEFYRIGSPSSHHFFFPSFDEADSAYKRKTGEYVPTARGYLNVAVYVRRMKLVLEPFLFDANDRAREANKKAYVHLVGLGLGVWMVDESQEILLSHSIFRIVKNSALPFISDLDFSYFPSNVSSCGKARDGEFLPDAKGNQIQIHFSKRDPAQNLNDSSKLLVACYAWDGNSYPGNEYWLGMLGASGDPAAVCCSQLADLQNPEINPLISGDNVFVSSSHDQFGGTIRPIFDEIDQETLKAESS